MYCCICFSFVLIFARTVSHINIVYTIVKKNSIQIGKNKKLAAHQTGEEAVPSSNPASLTVVNPNIWQDHCVIL